MKTAATLFLSLAASLAVCGAARAQSSAPGAASAADSRMDPAAATAAYLASVPPAQKARSDAYFEGGYWLLLWDFLAGALVSFLLLKTRLSARLRDLAAKNR